MASQISGESRILAVGLGVSVIAVLGLMRYMLVAFRDASEVEQPAPKTQYIDQKTEDALMPSTLEKLISSHNKDIQGITSRIVLDRTLHDVDTIGALLFEVTRKDPERREKALRALHLVCGESALSDAYTPMVIKALVVALIYCSTENDYPPYDEDFDNFDFRDPAENIALVTLDLLITERYGSTRYLTKTAFVKTWLARQNWGDSPEERHKSFLHLFHLQGTGRGNPLSSIVNKIAGQERGLQQLIEADLFTQSESVNVGDAGWHYRHGSGASGDVTYSLEEVLMDAATSEGGTLTAGGRRPIEQSAEERRLRRRNREVMVLNDGSQPLAMSDIIETI